MSDVIPNYRVVVMGKTGSGKSSACNRLIGHDEDDVFPVYAGVNGNTMKTDSRTATFDGICLQVIDTPDFFEFGNDVGRARAAFMQLVEDGPNIPTAVLLTVPMNVRFNSEMNKLYNNKYPEMLPPKYRNNIIIGFTKVDAIDGDVVESIQLVTLRNLLEKVAKWRNIVFRVNAACLQLQRCLVAMIDAMRNVKIVRNSAISFAQYIAAFYCRHPIVCIGMILGSSISLYVFVWMMGKQPWQEQPLSIMYD